jgi:hypothetical protein
MSYLHMARLSTTNALVENVTGCRSLYVFFAWLKYAGSYVVSIRRWIRSGRHVGGIHLLMLPFREEYQLTVGQ